MIKRWKWWVGVSVVLLSVQTVLACGGGPYPEEVCLPGLALLGAHIGLTLSILAACIERPFLSWAGVSAFPVEYSIQANFLGTAGTFIVTMFVVDARWMSHDLVAAWLWGSILLTAGLEWLWVVKPWKRWPRRVRFERMLLGNVISAGIIYFLPAMCHLFGTSAYEYRRKIWFIADVLIVPIFLACVVTFVMAFVRTRHDRTSSEDPRRGFEVIPAAMPVKA